MLLIVRTKERLQETCNVFPKACGLSISTTHPVPVNVPMQAQALVITSPQALDAFQHCIFPLICVGKKTAGCARKKGFNVVITGKGGAADLAQTLIDTHVLFDHICHVHGDTANCSWHKMLQKKGVNVSAVVGYKTTYIQALPKEIQKKLANKTITKVMLFSIKSAEHLLSLLNRASIDPSTLKAICLSPSVAQVAKTFQHVCVAAAPTVQAMEQALKKG